MNELSSTVGKVVVQNFQPSNEYTGKLFGVEYLYSQSGATLVPSSDEDFLTEIDEGFGDIDEELADPEVNSDDVTVALPPDSDSEEDRGECLINKIKIL